MTEEETTRERFFYAYSAAYLLLPAEPDGPCPNCGAASLKLLYRTFGDSAIGWALFWCSSCLLGVGISRCPIPPGAHTLRSDATPEETTAMYPELGHVYLL